MSLTIRPAGFQVRRLYLSAFPKEERFSFPFLKVLSLRRRCRFISYYADGSLAGISYTVEGEKMVFLLYLAVSEDMRSKGYGSEILSYLKNLYGKPLTLNIEPMDDTADNAEERRRRYLFYEKNGFYDTGFLLRDSQMTYTVLSTAKDFQPDVYYETLLGIHPGGFGMPEILKK